MHKVLTLDNIAPQGLQRLPEDRFEVGTDISDPTAIILRSYKMHDMEIPASVAAVGRAGAGTNNIPIDALSARGVPVFNTPGANANAVKELAIAGLLLAARNICDAREYVKGLSETGDALNKAYANYRARFFTPEEEEILKKGKSNKGFHYLGSAKVMAGIGKGFAEAMLELQKQAE